MNNTVPNEINNIFLKSQKSILIFFEIITYLFINLKLLFVFYSIIKIFLYYIQNIYGNYISIRNVIVKQIIFYTLAFIVMLFFPLDKIPSILIIVIIIANYNIFEDSSSKNDKTKSDQNTNLMSDILKWIFIAFIAIINFIITSSFSFVLFFMQYYSFDLNAIEEDNKNEDENENNSKN